MKIDYFLSGVNEAMIRCELNGLILPYVMNDNYSIQFLMSMFLMHSPCAFEFFVER